MKVFMFNLKRYNSYFSAQNYTKTTKKKKKKKNLFQFPNSTLKELHTPGKARRRKKTQFKYYSNVKGDTPT